MELKGGWKAGVVGIETSMVSETEDSTLLRAASEVKVVSSRVSAKEGSIVPEAASEAFITEPSLVSATDDSTLHRRPPALGSPTFNFTFYENP